MGTKKVVDTINAEHYNWGKNCGGWHFVKSESLSVIRETMPPAAKEKLHFHQKAQQFFYILSGVATFEIDGEGYNVSQGEGISILPGISHRISNNGNSDLEFLVVSEPKSHGDRVDIECGEEN